MDSHIFNVNEISNDSRKEMLDFIDQEENVFSEKCLRSVEDKLFVEDLLGCYF